MGRKTGGAEGAQIVICHCMDALVTKYIMFSGKTQRFLKVLNHF